MAISGDTSKRLHQQLIAHRDDLTEQFLQVLRETLFTSRAYVRPADLTHIATDEVDAWFQYLRQPDTGHPRPAATGRARGAHLCRTGLGEQAIFGMGRVLRLFCHTHLDHQLFRPGLETAETYHSALGQGFIRERETITLEEQERIRTALQKTINQYTLQMEVAAEVARAATSIPDLNQLLTTSVNLIQARFDFYYVGIFLVDQYGEWAILRAATGEPGTQMLQQGHKLRVGGQSMIGWSVAHGQSRIALDVGKEPVRFDNPLLPDTRSEMALPLIARAPDTGTMRATEAVAGTALATAPVAVIGAMTVQSRLAGAFTEQDLAILQIITGQLANAIQNARLLAQAQAQMEQLETIQNRSWTRQSLQTLSGYTYELSTDTFTPIDSSSPLDIPGSSYSFSYEGKQRDSYYPSPSPDPLPSGDPHQPLAAPITLLGQEIGTLDLYDLAQPRDWLDDEIALTETVLSQAAMAVENARLFQETQRRATQLATAAEVARDATAILDVDRLLNQAMHLISDQFDYYHASVFLLDEQDQYAVLQAAASQGEHPVLEPGYKLPIDDTSIVGYVASTGQPRITSDVHRDAVHFAHPDLPDTRSEMALPLRVQDRVIGVVDVQATHDAAFSQDDVAVLQTMADQLATAIANARAYEQLQETAEQLKEVDRLKSQFLANMSHELRTPLNSIIGFSRVILKGIDGPLTDLQRTDLQAVYDGGQHLLGLINDILDISKIEAGKMELTFENVDLRDIVKGVMSTAIALVKDKPVELQQELPPDLPTIRGDARRIRQVLLNLVSNASKFTEEGYIRVEIDPHPTEIIISVADSGVGIPPDKMDMIFEPFTQADASTTRRVGGTGLGLSISKRFAEIHGGRIWVESELDVGSTFYVAFPIQTPDQQLEAAEIASSDSGAQDTKKTILCVDDNDGVITLYRRYLSKKGYQVVGLTSSADVIEKAVELEPFAITLDVMMPGKDGWQIIQELKANSNTRRIPVIMCTIVCEKEYGLSLGASDYLIKPILEEELVAALQRLDLSENDHLVLVVDDQAHNRNLLRRMIESQRGYTVAEANGGQEAITLIRQLQPDVIILDLMMPDVDGFAVLESVKSDKKTRSIPIIVVTAKDLTQQERDVLNHGVEALLQKGLFEQQELLADVAAALERI